MKRSANFSRLCSQTQKMRANVMEVTTTTCPCCAKEPSRLNIRPIEFAGAERQSGDQILFFG